MDRSLIDMRKEHGLSIIEVVVVLVIIAILASFGIWTLDHSRDVGIVRAGVDAAQAYDNAVDQFRRDHAGVAPDVPGSADWPDAEKGPKPQMAATYEVYRYLRSIPDGIRTGTVELQSPGSTHIAGLTYTRLAGDRDYELVLEFDGQVMCSLGPAIPDNERCQ